MDICLGQAHAGDQFPLAPEDCGWQDAVQAAANKLTEADVKIIEEAAESTGVDTRGSWEMPMI